MAASGGESGMTVLNCEAMRAESGDNIMRNDTKIVPQPPAPAESGNNRQIPFRVPFEESGPGQ